MKTRVILECFLGCLLLLLLTACQLGMSDRQIVLRAVIENVLAGVGHESELVSAVFIKIYSGDENSLNLPKDFRLRLGDRCVIDPVHGVIDKQSGEGGLLIMITGAEIQQL